MRLRNLMLLVICAAFAFGGTFTCKSESSSSTFTSDPKTPAK